jgi:hypothetical protein
VVNEDKIEINVSQKLTAKVNEDGLIEVG